MKWSLKSHDSIELFLSVRSAIKKALCNPSQGEPQLVANLVWELPRALNALSFAGFTVQSGGVFVHAQPFVKCNNFPKATPKSVELGDLLLLRTEVRGKTVSNRRALLLQAKKVSSFPAIPDNDNQHYLYANWPHFQYLRSTDDLNGKERHVTGQDLYYGSRYLLIADPALSPGYCLFPCTRCVQTASPTKPNLSHYRCFISELTSFVLGDAGKEFKDPKHPSNKNWDRVMEDLRTVTAKRPSVFMAGVGGAGAKRGQGRLMFLSGVQPTTHGFLRQLWGGHGSQPDDINDGPPQVPENWPGENTEDGGISTIEFIVSSEDRAE